MKITINITKKEAEHLKSPHTFYDSCGEADDCLRKVQKEIDKILKSHDKNKKYLNKLKSTGITKDPYNMGGKNGK